MVIKENKKETVKSQEGEKSTEKSTAEEENNHKPPERHPYYNEFKLNIMEETNTS